MKKALEEEAKGYDTLALAILNSAAAQAMMTGKAGEGRKLFEEIGQFAGGLQELYAGRTGGKSGLSDAKKEAEALAQAMADLEAQTNRLTMTDEQFREWELTNRTLPKLREELRGAADAAQRLEKFEQATRSNWAKEDEEKAQEKARENLQIQADFYEQLREKSGRYGLGLEYVNKLIEQQAQAWKEAGIPEEYRKQLAEILRLEASTDGWDGARRAMRSYYADSMNMGRQFENFTSSTLSGLEDAFVDFAMTGKLSFSDLANSIISDLVRIAYQAMVVAPLLEGLAGGKSGGGGLLGGLVGGLLGGGSGTNMSVSGGLASGAGLPHPYLDGPRAAFSPAAISRTIPAVSLPNPRPFHSGGISPCLQAAGASWARRGRRPFCRLTGQATAVWGLPCPEWMASCSRRSGDLRRSPRNT